MNRRRKLCDRRIFRRRARPEIFDHSSQVLEVFVAAERRVTPNPGPTFDQGLPGRVHVSSQAGHRGMSDNENPFRHPGLPIRPSNDMAQPVPARSGQKNRQLHHIRQNPYIDLNLFLRQPVDATEFND